MSINVTHFIEEYLRNPGDAQVRTQLPDVLDQEGNSEIAFVMAHILRRINAIRANDNLETADQFPVQFIRQFRDACEMLLRPERFPSTPPSRVPQMQLLASLTGIRGPDARQRQVYIPPMYREESAQRQWSWRRELELGFGDLNNCPEAIQAFGHAIQEPWQMEEVMRRLSLTRATTLGVHQSFFSHRNDYFQAFAHDIPKTNLTALRTSNAALVAFGQNHSLETLLHGLKNSGITGLHIVPNYVQLYPDAHIWSLAADLRNTSICYADMSVLFNQYWGGRLGDISSLSCVLRVDPGDEFARHRFSDDFEDRLIRG